MLNLNEGEIICDRCNGSTIDPNFNLDEVGFGTCSKCRGTGKLNWLENVFGKRQSIEVTKTSITSKARQLKSNWTISEKQDLVIIYDKELLKKLCE